jgi:hypothetical protein
LDRQQLLATVRIGRPSDDAAGVKWGIKRKILATRMAEEVRAIAVEDASDLAEEAGKWLGCLGDSLVGAHRHRLMAGAGSGYRGKPGDLRALVKPVPAKGRPKAFHRPPGGVP